MDSVFIVLIAFAVFILGSIGAILVLWIAMPFSIFGTKDLLKKLIIEQEKTNKLLISILDANLHRDACKEGDLAEKRENTH